MEDYLKILLFIVGLNLASYGYQFVGGLQNSYSNFKFAMEE